MDDPHALSVSYADGDRIVIDVRGHTVITDQPVEAGGTDHGPTPTELLVASLASCMAFYAQRFLRRNEVPAAGLRIDARFRPSSDGPHRIGEIEVDVTLPPGAPERLRGAIARVMDGCTVHNTLREPPSITVRLI